MKDKSYFPLISVVVITYNSSQYVEETLDSIKQQTYDNIELIISDDGSTDKTISICEKWIEKYKQRFRNTTLITSSTNTGIAPNCNRGLNKAAGDWVKFIAGDDALVNNILSNYVSYINKNPDISCLYSNAIEYDEKFNEECKLPITNMNLLEFNKSDIGPERQFKILLNSNNIWACTFFIRRKLLIKLGGFNEKYSFYEDRPLYLKLTKAGYKIHYIDIIGGKYRRHSKSIQLKDSKINNFHIDKIRFFVYECFNHLSYKEKATFLYRYIRVSLIRIYNSFKQLMCCK